MSGYQDDHKTFYELESPASYWRGRVVSANRHDEKGLRYGHIAGFARNSVNELIINIAWEDGSENPVHPSILTLH